MVQVLITTGYWTLGLFDRAEEEFSRTFAMAPAGGPERLRAELARSSMLLDQRRLDEACALAAWIVQEAELRGEQFARLAGRLCLIEARLYKGAIEDADAEALALRDVAAAEPYFGMWYWTILAGIRLAQGRAGEAAEVAERALSQSRSFGMGFSFRHAMLLLVHAEALLSLGDRDAACQAIREAEEDLQRRAAKIPDPSACRSFLENIPDHRRTLELAREWLGEEGS
jgi:tetratricopeptide (TPR) repeat protein